MNLFSELMTVSSQSCGLSIHENGRRAACKHCRAEADFTLNPRIIGSLADETGCLSSGKLVWSDRAWSELFLGDSQDPWTELTGLGMEELRTVEEQLLYARVTLTFGWARTVGRLCILGVEWF